MQIFRLSTARMKINQILISFFEPRVSFPLNFLSVSWHIISLKFSSWNIICFGQKELINIQFFRLLTVLMKVHPIPHAIFETIRSGLIQILYHCSVSWKTTLLYFFSSNLIYFRQKEPIKVKFSDFWVVGWTFTKFLMSYLKPQVSFSLNFASLFSVMRDNSSVFFIWNFIWFGQKKPIKVQSATHQLW